MKKYKNISLQDVSNYANVSLITVSRVLNQPEMVSIHTRKRVHAAINRIGYVPNLNARSLVNQRTNMVGLVVPFLRSSLFADLAEGLAKELSKSGRNMLLAVSNRSQDEETKAVRTFIGRQADAIVLTCLWHNEECLSLLKAYNGPVVESCNLKDDPLDLIVGFNNFEASAKMTRYLISCGFHRIAVVGSNFKEYDQSSDRLEGFYAAMKEAKLLVPKKYVLDLKLEEPIESGYTAILKLMSLSKPPEAVYFQNEMFAHGALMACNSNQISVPEDVSITGFGDLNISKHLPVPLTTTQVKYSEVGSISGKLINKRLNGENIISNVFDVGSALITRQSVKNI